MFYVPASELARKAGDGKLSNIVLVGKMIRETALFSAAEIEDCLDKMIPEKRAAMRELNKKALSEGLNA